MLREVWVDQACFFFFNDTATTEIYTLSLHDALPISVSLLPSRLSARILSASVSNPSAAAYCAARSEEHTSELQSRPHLVCRLLLEKKKKQGSAEKDAVEGIDRSQALEASAVRQDAHA